MLNLHKTGYVDGCTIYSVQEPSFQNRYFVLTHPASRELMIHPEVVGYDSYLANVPSTSAALSFLAEQCNIDGVEILTILRGGLNYPLEECCFKAGMRVENISFLSCERIIEDGVITGLDIKYDKMHICKDATLMIGDIVASGQTLDLCLNQVVDRLSERGGSLKRIVFFTVGGTKAFPLMEGLTRRIRSIWPDFEGFLTFFYEGVFTVYSDHGVTGVNTPDIDFGWKGGLVAPEFRNAVLDDSDAVFEKCIIYDGGARRYEIAAHIEEVLDYWESLEKASSSADFKLFIEEKLGHKLDVSYEEWLASNGYEHGEGMKELYSKEKDFAQNSLCRNLAEICRKRIVEFKEAMKCYK